MQSPRREMPPGEHVGEAEPHDIRAADREAHPGIREERSLVEPALFGAPYFYTVFTQARAQVRSQGPAPVRCAIAVGVPLTAHASNSTVESPCRAAASPAVSDAVGSLLANVVASEGLGVSGAAGPRAKDERAVLRRSSPSLDLGARL